MVGTADIYFIEHFADIYFDSKSFVFQYVGGIK